MNQKYNNTKCQCECKNSKEHHCGKGYFWNPAKCSCKNGKYLGSTGNSVIICDEIIKEAESTSPRTIPTNTSPTKTVPTKCTLTSFYILASFLIITIASYDTSKLKETSITNML